jgi:hypothetical protein
MKLLFVCTTLNKDSTLMDSIDMIEDILMIQNVRKKHATLLYKRPSFYTQEFTSYGKELLESMGYRLNNPPVLDENMHTYLERNEELFDVVVFAQCSSLVHTFLGEQDTDMPFEYVFSSFMQFYNSIEENGYLINLYYGPKSEIKLTNVESFLSMTTFSHIQIHIFLTMCFSSYFTRISEGVYQKKSDILLYKPILDIFRETMKNVRGTSSKEEFAKRLYDIYIKEHDTTHIDYDRIIKYIVRSIQ